MLAGEIARLNRQAGDIASGPGQALGQAGGDGIAEGGEHNRDARRGLPGNCNTIRRADDDIDLALNKFGGELRHVLVIARRPAVFDRNVTAFGPAKFGHPLRECRNPRTVRGLRCPPPENRRPEIWPLLAPCGKGPSGSRAADQLNEFTPPHPMGPPDRRYGSAHRIDLRRLMESGVRPAVRLRPAARVPSTPGRAVRARRKAAPPRGGRRSR